MSLKPWTKGLGNVWLTRALLDRLTHRIHILEANGDSYRLCESRTRLKRRLDTASQGNLTPAVRRGCSNLGAALLPRPPPHFSTDVDRVAGQLLLSPLARRASSGSCVFQHDQPRGLGEGRSARKRRRK